MLVSPCRYLPSRFTGEPRRADELVASRDEGGTAVRGPSFHRSASSAEMPTPVSTFSQQKR